MCVAVCVFVCVSTVLAWFRFLDLISFGCTAKQSTEMWRRIIRRFCCCCLIGDWVGFFSVCMHAYVLDVENENHQVPRQQDEKSVHYSRIDFRKGKTTNKTTIAQRINGKKWWNYFNLFCIPSLLCDIDVVFVSQGELREKKKKTTKNKSLKHTLGYYFWRCCLSRLWFRFRLSDDFNKLQPALLNWLFSQSWKRGKSQTRNLPLYLLAQPQILGSFLPIKQNGERKREREEILMKRIFDQTKSNDDEWKKEF